MSAAEKLKGLGTRLRNADRNDFMLHVCDLENALPQIVAVIEAAEDFPEIFVVEGHSGSFVPLLDALEEKLS